MTALRFCSVDRLVISRRTVWPLNTAASLPLAMIRILPSSSCCSPNGGGGQATSICPVITCVSVDEGLPVAVGFAFKSYCLRNAVTMPWVELPFVEYAIVLSSVSLSDLIGELAGTYQYRSAAPVVSAPMTRTGAPFENDDSAPITPTATPTATLPEITAV